ncbi:MAG: enoyl-CoA hydratase/isomerase family protein [Bdellovibrionales bacterium]|nr:enoyl-CoA hydratase/isomerase family protein [Bdellovibrionales bacterium]
MNYTTLKFNQDELGVGLLKISRPEAMNALNAVLIEELSHFLTEVDKMSNLRCLVVTGDGEKAFVAGADIKEMLGMDPEKSLALSTKGQWVLNRLENLDIPVIASVNGFALGGGMELALSCDFVIASEKAKFGLPEVTLGLIPGYGGTQRLMRSIGVHRAKMMTFTGDIYPAKQLYEWGLISVLTSPEELEEVSLKIAKTIASRAPLALSKAKEAIHQARDNDLEQGLAFEREQFSQLFATEDVGIGVSAFIEKRKPSFSGK